MPLLPQEIQGAFHITNPTGGTDLLVDDLGHTNISPASRVYTQTRPMGLPVRTDQLRWCQGCQWGGIYI